MSPRSCAAAVLVLGALVVGGCKCGAKKEAVDAGVTASLAVPEVGKAQAVDLRTAMLTAFPDNRGVHLVEASAVLQRQLRYRVPHGQSLPDLLKPAIAEKGFRAPQPGDPPMVFAMKPPFALMASQNPGGLTLELVLPLAMEDFGKLAQTPTPMTTEQLQSMLPVPNGAKVLSDALFFNVQYEGAPDQAAARVRALVSSLKGSGWALKQAPKGWDSEDAGAADGGEPVLYELEKVDTGGKVRASIAGGTVAVAYVQPLVTH